MITKKIILGSKSPRRQELLAGIGIEFTIRTKDTDESYPDDLNPLDVPIYIAKKKAIALIEDLSSDEIIICADTVVIVDKTILGKPSNEIEAKEMLQLLSGKTHLVTTGVVIASTLKTNTFSSTTEVTFKDLSAEEINYYVSNYKPFDKAGSYGIQDWIGLIGISNIEGSYTNVVGLPTEMLFHKLMQYA